MPDRTPSYAPPTGTYRSRESSRQTITTPSGGSATAFSRSRGTTDVRSIPGGTSIRDRQSQSTTVVGPSGVISRDYSRGHGSSSIQQGPGGVVSRDSRYFFTTPGRGRPPGPVSGTISAGGRPHTITTVVPPRPSVLPAPGRYPVRGGYWGRPGFPVAVPPAYVRPGFPVYGPPIGVHRRYFVPARPYPYYRSGFGFGFGFALGFASAVPAYPVYQPYPVYMPAPVYVPTPVYEPVPVPVAEPYPVAQPEMTYPPSDPGMYQDGSDAGVVHMEQPAPPPNAPMQAEAPPPAPAQGEPVAAAPDAQAQQPPSSGSMPPEQVQRVMTEGVKLFESGEYDAAGRLFLQVGKANELNVDAWLAYAVARFATAEYEMAAIAIRHGLDQSPDVVNAPFDIRQRYGIAQDFERHLRVLEGTVLEHPDNPDNWLVLAFVRHFSGQRGVAARTFEVIRHRYPSDAELAELFLNAKPLEESQSQPMPPESNGQSDLAPAQRDAIQQEADAVDAGIAEPPTSFDADEPLP